MKILVIISIILYHTYIVFNNFNIFGLYKTHYKWSNKISSGIIFTLYCLVLSFTLIIPMLEYTRPLYKFIPFLTVSGLVLLGSTPWFKNNNIKRKIHYEGAFVSIIFSYLWAFIEGNMYVAGAAIILTTIIFLIRKRINRIYWLELIAFTNIYVQLILKIWK